MNALPEWSVWREVFGRSLYFWLGAEAESVVFRAKPKPLPIDYVALSREHMARFPVIREALRQG